MPIFVLEAALYLTLGISLVALIVFAYFKNSVVQARFRELDASFGKLFAESLTKRGLAIPTDQQTRDRFAFLALTAFIAMLFVSGLLLKLLREQ
jgi:hypothetical protein